MADGPEFVIRVDHNEARQGGAALGTIEALLERIEKRLVEIRGVSASVTNVLNNQRNVYVQNNVAITQVNQTVNKAAAAVQKVKRETDDWAKSLDRVTGAASRLLVAYSRLAASAGSVARSAGGAVTARAGQSFGGLFNGGGVAGAVGDVVRTPFAIGEFGLRLGGDLAQNLLGGFGKALSGVGGAIGGTVGTLGAAGSALGPIGAVGGILAGGSSALLSATASTAGGVAGIGGAILGALGQSAGAVLGAIGEFGGKIAESLTRGLSKGLTVGVGFSLFGLFKAAEFQDLEQGFKALLKGTEDEAVALKKLEDAAGGTISKIGILKAANTALSLEVAKTSDEIASLIQGSRISGRQLGISPEKAFDRIVTGLARGSLKVLDDLGYNPNREQAYRDYAGNLGVAVNDLTDLEQKAAFSAASLDLMRKRFEEAKAAGIDLSTTADRLSDLFDRLKAGASNLAVEWGTALTPAALEIGGALKDLLDDGIAWLELHRSEIAKGTVDFFRSIPGFFKAATTAAREYAAAFGSAIGLSDSTIKAGGELAFGGVSNIAGRASAFGSGIIQDLPNVLDKIKSGLRDVLTSDTVSDGAKYLGTVIGEAIWEGAKSGVRAIASSATGGLIPKFSAEDIAKIPVTTYQRRDPQNPEVRAMFGGLAGALEPGGVLDGLKAKPAAPLGNQGGVASIASGGGAYLMTAILAALSAEQGITGELSGRIGASGANPNAPGLLDFVNQRVSTALGAGANLDVTTTGGNGNLDRLIERSVRDFIESLKDATAAQKEELREDERHASGLERIRDRQGRAITDLVEQIGELQSAHIDEVAALRERTAVERAAIASRANGALAAAPEAIANRFAGAIDGPGISTHARHAFAREERLRRRDTARDINSSFGSASFSDPFGGVGFGGFGTGAPATTDAIGGLSGSLTSKEATADLLEAVKSSLAFAEEAAAIRNAYLAETAELERESAKTRAELEATFVKTMTDLNATLAGVQANERLLTEALTNKNAELDTIRKALVALQNQIRSVK